MAKWYWVALSHKLLCPSHWLVITSAGVRESFEDWKMPTRLGQASLHRGHHMCLRMASSGGGHHSRRAGRYQHSNLLAPGTAARQSWGRHDVQLGWWNIGTGMGTGTMHGHCGCICNRWNVCITHMWLNGDYCFQTLLALRWLFLHPEII
jgi:hypothetical protein